MSAEEIAKALGGKRNSKGGWSCRCPAHDDKNASFSITEGNKGSPVFYCHAGCTQEEVMDALCRKGLWHEARCAASAGDHLRRMADRVRGANGGHDFNEARRQHTKPEPEPEAEPEETWGPWKYVEPPYRYTDDAGTLLYEVRRKERFSASGKKQKQFPQRRPDGNGGWLDEQGERRVLYRWPDLVAHPDATLFVCEGEKDADRVASLGHCATTVANGNWNGVDVATAAGRDVLILEDADKPGVKKAFTAATVLKGAASTIRIVRLPGHEHTADKHGKDVSDWLDEDPANAEKLAGVCFDAPLWAPAADDAPPITKLGDWLKRDLPKPDLVQGHIMSTTSRVILWAPTGIGKTLWGVASAMAMAAGRDFLGWRGHRPMRVLYIDGEMSRVLLQERLRDEAKRLGIAPENFHALSHEDIEGFAPLNTPEGQKQIEREIARINPEFIYADNIMSLTGGVMKEEEGWRHIMPWVLSLTRRCIGQLWIHHTGHDETKGYGTKTREWHMDTVIGLAEVKRDDTDVSFKLAFYKKRLCTPANRADFVEKHVALVDDHWVFSEADKAPIRISPLAEKFLAALIDATIGKEANKMFGCPAASLGAWQGECVKRGLLEREKGKITLEHTSRSRLSKSKLELITANRIACNDTMAWVL